jgi:DNA-binding Lrp family transcriptional regulator
VAQFAVPINGTYDMLIYANSPSFKDYIDWDRDIRRAFMLKYKMRWEQSVVVFTRIGFYPLRNELLEHIRIADEDKKMLLLLNENSRIELKEISKILKINYKTCVYRFNELVKKRYIRRFTVSMDIPKDISLMSLFAKYVPMEDPRLAKDYTRKMFTTDEQDPLVGRYAFKLSLIGSYDSFAVGAFESALMGKKRMVNKHPDPFLEMTFGSYMVYEMIYCMRLHSFMSMWIRNNLTH